jgi:hypothetical protein
MDFKEIALAPMNGPIKRLVGDKGFGFILESDGMSTFSTTPCAVKRVSTICGTDRPSRSSEDKVRRAREPRTSRSRR